MMTFKSFIKGLWAFCSYVFVPQWGKHLNDDGTTEITFD